LDIHCKVKELVPHSSPLASSINKLSCGVVLDALLLELIPQLHNLLEHNSEKVPKYIHVHGVEFFNKGL